MKFYPDILTKKQKEVLMEMKFLKEKKIHLGGGTAIALQLGHRTSIDFDFYSSEDFEPLVMFKIFNENMKSKMIQSAKGTLIMEISGIIVSLFLYKYPLIRPIIQYKYVNLLSLEDLSAMKIIAIIQRGKKRDFIDLYFLIKKFGLSKILKFTKKKYGNIFHPYLALQALVFFDDAEKEPEIIRHRMKEKVEWTTIKCFITTEIKKLKNEI